ncbi:hypothetical protein BDQ17DRAFT_27335 [Cyathus striatus]|nr:hypothetical protein BDQ17DRAFT_27335 [Cyathus striatus]
MFSQLRHAVESLAQSPPLRSTSESSEDQRELTSRSRSLDLNSARPSSPLSSGQLAESALANLRKSLGTQRSAGTSTRNGVHIHSPSSESKPTMKSNLEERLRRATLVIGDAPVPTTPDISIPGSPAPIPTTANIGNPNASPPMSPASIPLPDSPLISPIPENTVDTQVVDNLQSSSPSPLQSTTALPDAPLQTELETPNGLPIVQNVEPITVPEAVPPNFQNAEEHHSPSQLKPDEAVVTNLQERLKQVEQRFSDVSTSFKRLQAEKLAADAILRELTPLESVKDTSQLRSYLQSVLSDTEMFQDEIKRLTGKLQRQESRIEELRDTHKLESRSQLDQIDKLRTQLQETEALFQATQASVVDSEKATAKQRTDMEQTVAEAERLKTIAKEEEEKRVKAVSLLKTVRQKLVKAEKEKEDAVKELTAWKEKGKDDKEKENTEIKKLQRELETLTDEKGKSEATLKAGFDKELSSTRDRFEKELSALKGQFELETATVESLHTRAISNKELQISSLEASLKSVTRDKNSYFDQLQLCQGELESARVQVESLSHQNNELRFQLRETADRLGMVKEELSDLRREQRSKSLQPIESPVDVAGLLSATEAKYESKVSELKRNLTLLEKERGDAEAEWSRKLVEKGKEIEDLKSIIGSTSKYRLEEEETTSQLKAQVSKAEERVKMLEEQVSRLPRLHSQLQEIEVGAKLQESEMSTKIAMLEQQIQEYNAREFQLKQNNKQIREELRKVQTSAAILEKQRNPGVGYWNSRGIEANSSNSKLGTSESRPASPGLPASGSKVEEEVNLEYLRNVILQFLEHKEMRPNLVRVLSIILRFTPQETRRLIAKI